MSSIIATTTDTTALATALLVTAKTHMRVDWNYEDAYITGCLRRAISEFERVTGVSVNNVTWEWRPSVDAFCNNLAVVPVSPVGSFTVKDANAVDISTAFVITTMSTHGVGLYALSGVWSSGMVVTIVSGYSNATLPDGVLDALLRYAAHLYEHREILIPGTQPVTPDWANAIATYWMPRA